MLLLNDKATFDVSHSQLQDASASGSLLLSARISRTGIQYYSRGALGLGGPGLDDGELLPVFRPEEEVFDAASMASMRGLPLTIDHPDGGVEPETYRTHAVGSTLDRIERDGDHLLASLVIGAADAIAAIRAGVRQLSVGYTLRLEYAEGRTFDGEAFFAIQREIRGNHVAILARGNCGPTCEIPVSAQDCGAGCECERCEEMDEVAKTTKVIAPYVHDGLPLKTYAAVEDALKDAVDERDKWKTKATQAEDVAATALERRDNRIKELEDEVKAEKKKTTPEHVASLVTDYLKIAHKAAAFLPADFNADGKSDMELIREALKTRYDPQTLADASDERLRGMFDALDVNAPPPASQIATDFAPVASQAAGAHHMSGYYAAVNGITPAAKQ